MVMAATVVLVAPPAASAAPIPVTVTILRLVENTCDEGPTVPCPDDWYSRVNIDNQGFQESGHVDNPPVADLTPHTVYTRIADTASGTVPVVIQIWDHDDSSADDHLDASPFGDDINLTVDLATGDWSGDSSPNVGFAEGANVKVFFDITVGSDGDLDDDGIPDGVERFGVRDTDGSVLVDMAALGADPCRKSIAVEIDFMNGAADGHSHQPIPAAITEAQATFNAAPVPAVTSCPYPGFPSAPTGIDFLVRVDDPLTEVANTPLALLDAIRDANFDRALRPYFHYVAFVHDQATGNSSSGRCCASGRDAIVSLGSWTNQTGVTRDQSGTLIHELGHAWGFGHGGGDSVNCKSNYLSVMNYSFQVIGIPDPTLTTGPQIDADGDGDGDVRARLDLSATALPTLNESALNEPVGVQGGSDGTFFNDSGGTDRWDIDGGGIDWNWDNGGVGDDTGVAADVNAVNISDCGNDGATPPNATPSPGQNLAGFDDWANLKYRAAMSPDAGFTPGTFDELTFDDAQHIRAALAESLRPDLVLTHLAGPDPVLSGSQVTYDLSVQNNSQGEADDTMITEVLPAGMVADSCSATVGNCAGTPNAPTASFGDLAGQASASMQVMSEVPCETADGTTITASAAATTTDNELNPDDNAADASVVVSNPPPVISGLSVSADELWPPNHKMETIILDYTVTDNCGTPALVVEVTSNEPVDGDGDGATTPDWIVIDANTVELRAERAGSGDGRVYTISVSASDSGGGATVETIQVTVPPDSGD